MFEGKSQKGLFTFYWEQSHNYASCQETEHNLLQDTSAITPARELMEGIPKSVGGKKNNNLRSSKSLRQILVDMSKQGRSTLKPNCVNLKPKIDDKRNIRFDTTKREKIKVSQGVQLARSERSLIVYKNMLDNNVLMRQGKIKCRPINIELPKRGKENVSKLTNFNPMKKMDKCATQSISKGQSRLLKISQLPNINLQIQERHVKLPNLDRKPSIKKQTSPKIQFSLQQFMLERLLMTPCSSVINLGSVYVEDEQLSWRLRKQKFLQQLGRSSLHN